MVLKMSGTDILTSIWFCLSSMVITQVFRKQIVLFPQKPFVKPISFHLCEERSWYFERELWKKFKKLQEVVGIWHTTDVHSHAHTHHRSVLTHTHTTDAQSHTRAHTTDAHSHTTQQRRNTHTKHHRRVLSDTHHRRALTHTHNRRALTYTHTPRRSLPHKH